MAYVFIGVMPLLLISAVVLKAANLPEKSPSTDISAHIVGGVPTRLGEIPWQVSLSENNFHICGGSIVDANWVITAAHCVHRATARDLQVKAGFISLSNPGATQQTRNVAKIFSHELFNPDLGQFGGNDIAVLRLNTSLTFNGFVSGIPLPPTSGYIAKGDVIVSGWGAVEEGGVVSDTLNGVVLPVLSYDACYQFYGDDMSDRVLCAGFEDGQKDACQGDSGGPMTCVADTVLCGVVSGGEGCARQDYPGVYTNVAHYLAWLAEQMA